MRVKHFSKTRATLSTGYYRMENPRNAKIIGLELRLDSDFGKFKLGGIIDRLEYNEKNELVVSDYKTGKVPDSRFGANKMDNMHIYASLCLRERGELPKRLRLMYLKSSTPIEVEVTPESNAACEAAAIETSIRSMRRVNTGVFATKKSGLCNFVLTSNGARVWWRRLNGKD